MSALAVITERWLAAALAAYGDTLASLAARERDPFRNPVGAPLRGLLGELVGELQGAMDGTVIDRCFAEITAVRAVQDFTPAQALGFVFELRPIAAAALPSMERAEIDARIDRLALAAFTQYLQHRTRLADLKLEEARRALGPLPYRLRVQQTAEGPG